MTREPTVAVGRIVRPHGVRGEDALDAGNLAVGFDEPGAARHGEQRAEVVKEVDEEEGEDDLGEPEL